MHAGSCDHGDLGISVEAHEHVNGKAGLWFVVGKNGVSGGICEVAFLGLQYKTWALDWKYCL